MKHKDLDKILNQLGDFDPQAKPNWEGFIAENESHINPAGKTPGVDTGKKAFINSSLRYAGIVAVVAIGLVLGWYFAGNPAETAQPDEEQLSPQTEVVNEQSAKSENVVDESKELANPVEAQDKSDQIIVSDQPEIANPVQTDMQEAEITFDTEIPTVNNQDVHTITEQPEKKTTILIKDTVFVKKTIYVTDTVKRK